jgi:Legionella pneumophila major outer membrane protein precursor
MNRLTKLAILSSLALTASAISRPALAATIEEQNAERLNSVERENAELRQRLKLIESSIAKSGQALPRGASRANTTQATGLYAPGQPAGSEALGSPSAALDSRAQAGTPQFYKSPVGTSNPPRRFEVSGSLLYLQAGADDLEYATLVSPLPLPTPHWNNQSLSPHFSPAFKLGLRYIPVDSNDIELNWTHMRTSASASVFGAPGQMVGPPFEIGPTASVYQIGYGNVSFAYDSANLDAGHTFCGECAFQLRVFGGVEFARIGQDLTGTFQSLDGLTTAANTTTSLFTGAGPRVGLKGQYGAGNFQFFGEMAGAGLIGTGQSRINFSANSTAAPGLAQPNNQSLTSPDKMQVVPGFDARLGTAYTFPPSNAGQLKIEVGYQAAVYMGAINHYALSQVAVPPAPASVGVFLATAQHLQSNFTTQGPYLTAGWSF